MKISSLTEFKSLLKSKNISYKEANKGYLYIRCPTCDADNVKKMKRYIHFNHTSSNCFICQERLWLSDILDMKIEVDKNIKVDDSPIETTHPQATQLPIVKGIPINELPLDHPAIKFLQKDHFHDFDTIWNNFSVTFIEEGIPLQFGKYSIDPKDSLLFPVSFEGNVIGWQIRFIPGTKNGDFFIGKKRKYLHLYSKSNFIYNVDNVVNSPFVIVVEGAKKAWKHSAAIATMGKDISNAQLKYMAEHYKKIMFMLDADDGQKKVKEYMSKLSMSMSNCIAIDPGDYNVKSPDEMTFEQMKQIVDEHKQYIGL